MAAAPPVVAQTLPGPADVGRIPPAQTREIPDEMPPQENVLPVLQDPNAVPEGAETVELDLRNIVIEGATAFPPAEFEKIYKPYLGKTVTLDVVYRIASEITALYRNAGYFLSLAYVPNQKIADGVVRIRVVEGAVSAIEIDQATISHGVIRQYTERLLAQKPLKSDQMESFLLRLNDLPGYVFRAVLSPVPGGREGEVKLALLADDEPGRGMIGFDNFSSRFLGPHQLSGMYEASFLPLHQTSISGVAGLQFEKLKYLTLGHSVVIAPDVTLSLNANITSSRPGYTLEPLEVKSRSDYLSAELKWQYLRQRSENMALSLLLDRRNTDIDFLGTPFTRDRIRALRLKAHYDWGNGTDAYNWLDVILSRGLSIWGATDEGDDNLSRAEAKPDFTKLEVIMTRVQNLPKDFSLSLNAAGQVSSGALYSSEEFGYGGQPYGRAYDASEITGDHGVSASAELQYHGIETPETVHVAPYLFYDIGAVWNEDEGQSAHESGASAGVGARISADPGITLNVGVAFPLTRDIAAPVYGGSSEDPRFFFQITKEF